MPSPFPGMDPYAERGDLWLELHNALMVYARDALQPILPENYVARLELRIYTDFGPGGPVRPTVRIPDLELVRTGPSVATLPPPQEEALDEGYWFEGEGVEQQEAWISIRSLPGQDLVTAVELLSPANKQRGPGREEYLRKQSELLAAAVNLVEIDLLRGGTHTAAAPQDRLAALPAFDYLLSVRRAAHRTRFWVAPWTVRKPLPRLPIPLGPGDSELRLPLQPLFDRAYDNAALAKLIDYTGEPDPTLRPEDSAWADELLRAAGLRGAAGA